MDDIPAHLTSFPGRWRQAAPDQPVGNVQLSHGGIVGQEVAQGQRKLAKVCREVLAREGGGRERGVKGR